MKNINVIPKYLILIIISIVFIASCFTDPNSPPQKLLLVSIDGFRADYMDLYETPNLDHIIQKGVKAEYMIPIFPTKTFPTHYSIVTGLYPENSGIVSNVMYDPGMDAFFSLADRGSVMDARWYGGEPIWVTAEKQGLLTAPMFWPGSEAPIKGVYADRWYRYDQNLSYSARVDSINYWLGLADHEAPRFMTLYFSKVDTYGHRYGPISDSVAVAVAEVDAMLGKLLRELENNGFDQDVNIIIVSDHGMAEISNDRLILLDGLLDLEDVIIRDLAPVTMMEPKHDRDFDLLFNSLKEQENNYKVYKKNDLPEEYNLKNNIRVPELILIADPGYTIATNEWLIGRVVEGGNHGYDHRAKEMRSLFIGYGPSFKNGYTSHPFSSVHIYELMSHLLDIEPSLNDGSPDSLQHVLK